MNCWPEDTLRRPGLRSDARSKQLLSNRQPRRMGQRRGLSDVSLVSFPAVNELATRWCGGSGANHALQCRRCRVSYCLSISLDDGLEIACRWFE